MLLSRGVEKIVKLLFTEVEGLSIEGEGYDENTADEVFRECW